MAHTETVERVLNLPTVFSRAEVLSKPSPVPTERGLYVWYFRDIPGVTPTDGCIVKEGLALLYAGISPKNDESRENLRNRVTYHYRGNAEGSTLRLTLGVLLADESGFPLSRVGTRKRMTFTHLGEQWLDQWMEENAYVSWLEHPSPWTVENQIIDSLSLPLNIQGNTRHPFVDTLSSLRRESKRVARESPVADEGDQHRRL